MGYQLGGLLGYRLPHHMVMQAGWRYLDVNYEPSTNTSFVFDTATSGVIVGVTINVK